MKVINSIGNKIIMFSLKFQEQFRLALCSQWLRNPPVKNLPIKDSTEHGTSIRLECENWYRPKDKWYHLGFTKIWLTCILLKQLISNSAYSLVRYAWSHPIYFMQFFIFFSGITYIRIWGDVGLLIQKFRVILHVATPIC